ncbi:hypothetical protein NA57DRAFT_49434, partial [Rhizodiscina lignyota]
YRQDLLVLIHIIGGQLARGIEIVIVQYKNSADSAGRGIFVEDRIVVYIV